MRSKYNKDDNVSNGFLESPQQAAEHIKLLFGEYLRNDAHDLIQVIGRTDIFDNDRDFVEDAVELGLTEFEAMTANAVTITDDVGDRHVLIKRRFIPVGALLHEFIRAFSSPEVFEEFGGNVDEGLAEFFTRESMAGLNIDRGILNYRQFSIISALADSTGQSPLARGFFGGELEVLERSVDNVFGQRSWQEIVALMQRGDYDQAERIIERRRQDDA
jgi:hypothetical protein